MDQFAPTPTLADPGPMLLPPLPGGEARIDHAWSPPAVLAPRARRGSLGWLGIGFLLLVASWLGADLFSFVSSALARHGLAGWVVLAGVSAAGLCLATGVAIEARGLARLRAVDRLRLLLSMTDAPVEPARAACLRWLDGVPDVGPAVAEAVRTAPTIAGLRAALRADLLPRLAERARGAGLRAAVEGGALVAVLPSDALDGLAGALRGFFLVRRIAGIYGLRPGPLVLAALLRRIAWTAAAIAGTQFFVQTLTDHALRDLPVFRHFARASGMSVAAYRLYRLAAVTAEACAPLAALEAQA